MGVDMLSLLSNSIRFVDGDGLVIDITVSDDEFEGGSADSRSERIWGDDELE
ncbi:MAG: hypothetical protein K6F89_06495 [Prevotella sp.]|nr:hypothetical protein [Prevotella sp.]